MSSPADLSPTREEGRTSTLARLTTTAAAESLTLTDDLIVEILSRAPAKSLCRFKCVSKHWLSLITHHREHRKKLPQTISGFFYDLTSPVKFISVSGRCFTPIDTCFEFLPDRLSLDLLDCCNGLLLCGWYDDPAKPVFLNGHLHLQAYDCRSSNYLAVVDTKCETWVSFRVPGGLFRGFIQQSQGRLHYANFHRDVDDHDVFPLVVYVLENYESKEWIFKHSVETSVMFAGMDDENINWARFDWVAIHPDCNLMFFTIGLDTTLMCYNMDHRQVKVISNLADHETPYLPYVPLYAELQSLHN